MLPQRQKIPEVLEERANWGRHGKGPFMSPENIEVVLQEATGKAFDPLLW